MVASLKAGEHLTEDEARGFFSQGLERAYERALRFLGYRPRSRWEVERFLLRKKVIPEIRDAVLERLANSGLVDDEAFARYWVENRESFSPRSLRMLEYELKEKGVAGDVIDRALEGLSEEESAFRAAMARVRKLGWCDREVACEKLSGFLHRRGFSYEVIQTVVHRILDEL